MKLRNKLLIAAVPAATIATAMPIAMASCSKGEFDDVKNAFEQTEADVTIVTPTTQEVAVPSWSLAVAQPKVQENYVGLINSNTDYLKQDVLNFFRGALSTLQNPVSNASWYSFDGSLKYKIDEINLVTTTTPSATETPFCAKLSFAANFSFDEDEYFTGKRYTVSVDLTGTVDIDNLFFQVMPKNFESSTQSLHDWTKMMTMFYAIDPSASEAQGLTFGVEFKQEGTVRYTDKATGTTETLEFTSSSDPITFSYDSSLVWTLEKAMECPLAYLAARYHIYESTTGKSKVVPQSISLKNTTVKVG